MNFYGFSQLPFSNTIAMKDIFITHSHSEAPGMLELGSQAEDLIVLTGVIGIGKSVVLRSFMHELDPNKYIPVYIRGTNLSDGDLYKIILSELNIDTPHFTNKAKYRFFKSIPGLSRKPVIILDDRARSITSLIALETSRSRIAPPMTGSGNTPYQSSTGRFEVIIVVSLLRRLSANSYSNSDSFASYRRNPKSSRMSNRALTHCFHNLSALFGYDVSRRCSSSLCVLKNNASSPLRQTSCPIA
jgi:hypothetical protein